DSFFALGGHSLLAAQLAARLGRTLGMHVPLRLVFDAPTVRALAQRVQAQSDKAGKDGWVIAKRADPLQAPLSLMQHRLWFLEQADPGGVVFNTPSGHRL